MTSKHQGPYLWSGGGYGSAACSCGWEVTVRRRYGFAVRHAQYLWALHVGGQP